MKHLNQLTGQIRKDVLGARWPLLLFVVATVLLTIESLRFSNAIVGAIFPQRDGPMQYLPEIIVVMLAFLGAGLAAAQMTQGDSPVEPTSFWHAQPASATVVALSKFCITMLGILGLVASAQLFTLYATGLSVSNHVLESADPLYYIASLLSFVLLVSAVFSNITTALFAFCVLVLVRALSESSQPIPAWRMRLPAFIDGHMSLALFVAIALATWLWLHVAQSMNPKLKRLVAMASLSVLTFGWDSRGDSFMPSIAIEAGESREIFPVVTATLDTGAQNLHVLKFSIPVQEANTQYVFVNPAVTVISADGTRRQVRAMTSEVRIDPALSHFAGRAYEAPFRRDGTVELRLQAYEVISKMLSVAGTTVTLDGLLVKHLPTTVLDAPLREGETNIVGDRRFSIARISTDSAKEGVSVSVLESKRAQMRVVRTTAEPKSLPERLVADAAVLTSQVEFQLAGLQVNAIRGDRPDTVPLARLTIDDWGNPLAFPTPQLIRQSYRYMSADRKDFTWMRDSRLLVREWRYAAHQFVHAPIVVRGLSAGENQR